MRIRFLTVILFITLFFTSSFSSVSAQTSTPTFQLPHLGRITTYFSNSHPGIDIATNLGTPIRPILAGTVTQVGQSQNGLGLMVEVQHDNGYRSIYGHMGNIYISSGQKVSTNDILGSLGITGNTTGPHTHLEIYKDNLAINPLSITQTLLSVDGNQQGTGGSEVTSLPRTGLTDYLWLGLLFLPLGWFLIKIGHIKKADFNANYIYLTRQIIKD